MSPVSITGLTFPRELVLSVLRGAEPATAPSRLLALPERDDRSDVDELGAAA